MADQNSESPVVGRPFPKWLVILSVCVFTLTVAGVSRHYYLGWKEKKLVCAAWLYLETDKRKEMRSALDRVLTLNPSNIEAFRISGKALLKDGNSRALPWLRRTVELAPENFEDQMALAGAAQQFGQNQEALKVVREMEAKGKDRADFQDLAGRVMQAAGQVTAAESHYAAAVRLAPDNLAYQLHLAVTRLSAEDPEVREKARNDIAKLSPETSLRAVALRALIVDAVRIMQTSRALSFAAELDALPGRVFSDRLMYLEVLHLVSSPDFLTRLAETQDEAAKNPERVLPLLYWMNGNNLSLLAKDWALHLPPAVVAPVAVRLEIARAYAAFGDWKKLRFFLADETWGDFDYMKRAYLARCYREIDLSDKNSKTTWTEALNTASSNGDALLALARLAIQWRWDTEAADALWQAVAKSNRSTEALSALCVLNFSKRDTEGLYRAYSLLVDRNPNDAASRNNLAIFSLLLGKDKERAVNIASELYGKEPTNPVYASTYAFALFCTDKKPKAVEVMKGLKPEDLRTPSVAAYYSAFLAAVGRSDEAEEYRKLARGAVLLPEEERILNIVPVKEAPEATPAPAVVEVPVQATPAPAVVDVPVQATPAPAAVEVPVQATPAPAAVDVPVQATPAPAAVDVPVQATPTPAPAASPSTP